MAGQASGTIPRWRRPRPFAAFAARTLTHGGDGGGGASFVSRPQWTRDPGIPSQLSMTVRSDSESRSPTSTEARFRDFRLSLLFSL